MVRFVSAAMALAIASPILAMPQMGTPTQGNGTTVTVVTTATSTAYVCECALQCSNEKQACLSVPDCDKEACLAKYHECVGHKPPHGDAKECTKEAANRKFVIVEDECDEAVQCRQQCDNQKDQCMSVPGCDVSACTASHYVCHTVCTSINQKNKDNGNNKNNNGKYDQCIQTCETTKTTCLAVPGCDEAQCHSQCETCKVTCDNGKNKGNNNKGNNNNDNGNKNTKPNTNGKNADQCVQVCETTKTTCLAVPGCDVDKCHADCETCKVVCKDNGNKNKGNDNGNKNTKPNTNDKHADQCVQTCETTKTSCLAVPGCDVTKCNGDYDKCKVTCTNGKNNGNNNKGNGNDNGNKNTNNNGNNKDNGNKKGSNECEIQCYTAKDTCNAKHGNSTMGHGANSCDSECTICLAKCPGGNKMPVTAGSDRAQPMLAAALVAIGFAAFI